MSESAHLPVEIDFDPERWMRGPDVDTSADDAQRWVEQAVAAYVQHHELADAQGGEERIEYVSAVLEAFSRWESPAQLRFLRLGAPDEAPVPAGLEVYGADQLRDVAAQFPGEDLAEALTRAPAESGDRTIVGEVSLEDVEDAPGWRRLFYTLAGADRELYSFARYVYAAPDGALVLVLRFGGDTPGVVVSVVPDADALVRSVRFAEGRR